MPVPKTAMPAMLLLGGLMVTPNVSLTPRYEAVKVSGVGTDTVGAVMLNGLAVVPGGIVRVDGKFAPAGDELRVIVAPEAGAGAVSATRQLDEPCEVIVAGLH